FSEQVKRAFVCCKNTCLKFPVCMFPCPLFGILQHAGANTTSPKLLPEMQPYIQHMRRFRSLPEIRLNGLENADNIIVTRNADKEQVVVPAQLAYIFLF